MKTAKDTQGNDLLRQARIGCNWRQHELAEQLGTTTVTVKRWERGYQHPSPYFRVKLCTLFDKSAEELGLSEGDPSTPMTEEDASENERASISPIEAGALWMVPYARNPHFTGRDDLLEQLAQEFSFEKPSGTTTTRRAVLNQPQAIKGLGGIGKTQIALEYAYRSREQGSHTHILWINAASEEAIITSFLTLAERLPDFAARDEKYQHKLIAAILHWLEVCQEPWLLIVDNADDLTLVQPYLPRQGQGSILLTTRAHAVAWLANAIEVEQMGLLEGTRFLLHRTRRLSASDEECNEATNVVITLDGLPLALDQAGAYIEETGCSIGDYLQLYEQHRARLLARRGKQATNYPDSVATTWSLSFQKVEQAYPAAAMLLRLCASLSPDHIPEELLTDGAAYWPSGLQEAMADPLIFNELLSALLAFSLVKRLAQERLLSLHRMVQVVQLDRMDLQEQRLWAERVVYAVNTVFPAHPKEQVETWPRCLRYLEQVQACDTLIQQHSLQLPEAADLLDRAGVYLREHASYSLAESLFQRALVIVEQQLGSEHPQLATPLSNLGVLYYRQGQYEQAELLYQRALLILEQALGPDHPQVASPLLNLGTLYGEQGQYEQAELLLQRGLHIREQALGPEHSLLASPLNNLGILYKTQGRYGLAESLLLRALLIWEQTLGPDHPQVASPLTNLGTLYKEQGQYEQAKPLYQQALRIREQTLSPDHPLLAYPLSNLGELYRQQSQYELAEPLLQRALHIREQALGLHHPLLADPLNELANLSRDQGQYQQAEILYQRALSLRQESRGQEHPEVAETLHDLARLREMQQQFPEALSLYQHALAIQVQRLGSHHPRALKTREALLKIEAQMGEVPQVASNGQVREPESVLWCACGCGRQIATSASRGKPRRFFSNACKQRAYRHDSRHKRHTLQET
jgi:tetratricopeptide (TPR) repeat protein/transcriptional regulator with XRE-family HTH domain